MISSRFMIFAFFVFGVIVIQDNLNATQIVSMTSYFPEVEQDFSRITWDHAVNNRSHLNTSLDGNLMMLECDISLGYIKDLYSRPKIPIMAHPPDQVSDISFEDWLDLVIKAKKRKGIKLDFKNIEVVEPSLRFLENSRYKIDFPVWINADILPGPVGATTTPLSASRFLQLCRQYFPESVISPGWTTFNNASTPEAARHYGWSEVLDMALTLRRERIVQPVTFPVRAVFVAASIEQLVWLTQVVADSTLTVWSGKEDAVDVSHLLHFAQYFARNKVFYDLPTPLNEQFHQQFSLSVDQADTTNAACTTAPLTRLVSKDQDPVPDDCLSACDKALSASQTTKHKDRPGVITGECALAGGRAIILVGNSHVSFTYDPKRDKRTLLVAGSVTFLQESPVASRDAEHSTIEFCNCPHGNGSHRLWISQYGTVLHFGDGGEPTRVRRKMGGIFGFRVESAGNSAGDVVVTLVGAHDGEESEFVLGGNLGAGGEGAVLSVSGRGSVPKVLSNLEYPCFTDPLAWSAVSSSYHNYPNVTLFLIGLFLFCVLTALNV